MQTISSMSAKGRPAPVQQGSRSHMPRDSVFFEKIVPTLLVLMGVITLGLILFAAGVLLGLVHF
jgi:hypothetical protein